MLQGFVLQLKLTKLPFEKDLIAPRKKQDTI